MKFIRWGGGWPGAHDLKEQKISGGEKRIDREHRRLSVEIVIAEMIACRMK